MFCGLVEVHVERMDREAPTATALTSKEPSSRARTKRSQPSSSISRSLLAGGLTSSAVDARIVFIVRRTTSLSNHTIVDLGCDPSFAAMRNGSEEKRSRDACNCRRCGASTTGRNMRNVESDVMV
jgi:hypothetical protein